MTEDQAIAIGVRLDTAIMALEEAIAVSDGGEAPVAGMQAAMELAKLCKKQCLVAAAISEWPYVSRSRPSETWSGKPGETWVENYPDGPR